MERNKLRELVEQAKMNNRWAMAQLTAEYKQQVTDSCMTVSRDREDAARIALESFQNAFERLDELDSPDNFLPWVSQLARERCGNGYGLKKQEALATTGQTTQLTVPEAPGAISTEAPSAVTAPVEKKSGKGMVFAVVGTVLALAIIAAGAFFMLSGRNGGAQAPEQTGGWSADMVSGSELHQAYAVFFDKNHRAARDRVYLADVTDDGADELFVVCDDMSGTLVYIYTMFGDEIREIYRIPDADILESMGALGICEYGSRQCLYEQIVSSWTLETGAYTEMIFLLDENGNRKKLAYWDETIDREPLRTGIFHFTISEGMEIRDLCGWAEDVFGLGD